MSAESQRKTHLEWLVRHGRDVAGWKCRVPKKNGRGFWWVTVLDGESSTKAVKVQGATSAGKPWWVPLADVERCKAPKGGVPLPERDPDPVPAYVEPGATPPPGFTPLAEIIPFPSPRRNDIA